MRNRENFPMGAALLGAALASGCPVPVKVGEEAVICLNEYVDADGDGLGGTDLASTQGEFCDVQPLTSAEEDLSMTCQNIAAYYADQLREAGLSAYNCDEDDTNSELGCANSDPEPGCYVSGIHDDYGYLDPSA